MSFCCWNGQKVGPQEAFIDENDNNTKAIYDSNIPRKCTDIFFLLVFISFFTILIVLIGYCVSHGDIYRILNGYDDCGNICGRDNDNDKDLPCKGVNRLFQRYLLIQSFEETSMQATNRLCVNDCNFLPGYKAFLNRCIPEETRQLTNTFLSKTGLVNYFQEVSEDLDSSWKEILYLCLIAFVFSILILILLRYLVGIVVWLVLLGAILSCLFGTIFLWIKWKNEFDIDEQDQITKKRTKVYLIYAIIATILTVCVSLIVLAMRKRIKLVIQLFKEAGKSIASMPFILFEPILTFVSLAMLISLWVYFSIWIESSGTLSVGNNQSVKYVKDPTMIVTRWYNLLGLFWFSQFIIGCQHMVIAGAVGTWFFTRNKTNMNGPINRSFVNLIRFHLGTVAMGSLLIAVVQIIRLLVKTIQYAVNKPRNRVTVFLFNMCECCLTCFERFLQYLTRNAYIESAMFGYSFCEAGRTAFHILSNNALRVFAINSVGDFVLFLGKIFVVMATVLVGMELIQKKEGLHHAHVPLILAGLFAYLVSHCFLTVFEMTVDTIFLCFCEDCEQNDGITRPYFMSRGLMEFVQNSKKALTINEKYSPSSAWAEMNSKKKKKAVSISRRVTSN